MPSGRNVKCQINLFLPFSMSNLQVHIFWEGHKILRNIHRIFDWQYIVGQIYSGDFAKLCGLLRINKLYFRKCWCTVLSSWHPLIYTSLSKTSWFLFACILWTRWTKRKCWVHWAHSNSMSTWIHHFWAVHHMFSPVSNLKFPIFTMF